MIEEAQYPPMIGAWYRDECGQRFEIVAVDEHDWTIEVQFEDGDVAEYDFDAWPAMDARPAAPPGDGYGPFDDQDKDARAFGDIPLYRELWFSPLDELETIER